MKSNVGSSNAGTNGSPIILLNTSEEINGYRIAKKNLAMEKDLETKQFIESQKNSSRSKKSR
ncbi:hypothetical protein DICPUDRAFT_155830 [Dictyostelium purpureum]|uniref:Uncharacterized protein n=1 Tax=Dictyostelium purpureum TaxID=5786 RepID=F0ZV03_DICPU|nr:uncharacterized protein DICPUDRAFT_155830 [Dictyostelium purpureum]EGC32221.1 hypothetical protein DICPUDRAFT_155830 [Dictyostelium purpureum]|eukprot:XP_003291257.1 hypothetical protein DICPUDRAFT_155830 [Dictyostelium purpureum]